MNCNALAKPLRLGRCSPCRAYLRRTGEERPSRLWLSRSTPLAERYWPKVDQSGEHWLFTGAKNDKGYGHIRKDAVDGSKDAPAHRVAWFLETGDWPPDDLFVCHHCDIPNCVRPDHLFLGTQKDNLQDASRKGRCLAQANPERMARGERNGNSKLTAEVVLELRRLHKEGASMAGAARKLGVGPVTARKAILGLTWAWL